MNVLEMLSQPVLHVLRKHAKLEQRLKKMATQSHNVHIYAERERERERRENQMVRRR